MQDAQVDFNGLLAVLSSAGVEFIVVGGVCAALHGAPVSTFDLDIIYSRSPPNLARLEQALKQLEASYRMKPGASPDSRRLDGPGHHQLMTRFGPLDLLGSTVGGQGYNELIENTEQIDLGIGAAVRILDLPTLIRIKESLSGECDKAVLPILRRTLKEKSGK
jgi:hypothetical protein